MIPDFLIKGWWVECFLIYWAVCYFLYFAITWISFKMKPWDYPLWIWLAIIPKCINLPIVLPFGLWRNWKEKREDAAARTRNKPGYPEDGTKDL